jgi:hypothetical protein
VRQRCVPTRCDLCAPVALVVAETWADKAADEASDFWRGHVLARSSLPTQWVG